MASNAAPLGTETEAALARWAAAVDCRLVVLFGSSAAEGTGRAGDIDIALWFLPMPAADRRLRMIGEIQDLCGRRRADIVFLRPETNPVLRFEIFRGGRPLHEAAAGVFVSEVVRALALYEDALPFRRMLRDSIIRRAVKS